MTRRRGPGRPPLPPEERRELIAVRLHPDTITRLDALAERHETTRTAIVERGIDLVDRADEDRDVRAVRRARRRP